MHVICLEEVLIRLALRYHEKPWVTFCYKQLNLIWNLKTSIVDVNYFLERSVN